MLIEFRVANFRAIKKSQTFSMVKDSDNEICEENAFQAPDIQQLNLLKTAAIYGPNASGKSTIIRAISAMENIILNSGSHAQRGDSLAVTPFLLSETTRTKPSEFEITFISEKVRYQYGFSATALEIHNEWLYAFPQGRAQLWFSRTLDRKATKGYAWKFGTKFSGEKQLWKNATRENSLFLSTAIQLNNDQLKPVFDWFRRTLRITDIRGWGANFSASMCSSERKKNILDFLHSADLNIGDIEIKEELFDPGSIPSDIPKELRKGILLSMKDQKVMEINTVHFDDKNQPVKFSINDESDGTQKLFGLAGPFLDVLENGYVLFFDELNNSLHPDVVKFLVNAFNNKKLNKKNAQLVFTTHETSILKQEILRRDQIWFCEKQMDQSTSLFPLTDFSPRKGRENIELAYTSGRYGAKPNLSELKLDF